MGYNVNMITHILSYLCTFVVFLVIDFTWLGFVAKSIYRKEIGALLAPSFDMVAAGVFYMLFVLGLYIFVIIPGVEKKEVIYTLQMGALFGFFTYMTYDLTNKATLINWSWKITCIDIVWGIVLSALVSCAGYYIYQLISHFTH